MFAFSASTDWEGGRGQSNTEKFTEAHVMEAGGTCDIAHHRAICGDSKLSPSKRQPLNQWMSKAWWTHTPGSAIWQASMQARQNGWVLKSQYHEDKEKRDEAHSMVPFR